MDDWKTILFPIGFRPMFRGNVMLVSGSVSKVLVLFHTENATWGHLYYGEGMFFRLRHDLFFQFLIGGIL